MATAPPQISERTLSSLCQALIGYSQKTITDMFYRARVPCDVSHRPDPTRNGETLEASHRRGLVEQHYHALDLSNPEHTNKLLLVIGKVLKDLDLESALDVWTGRTGKDALHARLLRHLRHDGFDYADGEVVDPQQVSTVVKIETAVATLDAPYLRTQIERISEHVEKDPRLAIGTAKELVETTCKTILKERGQPVTGKPDVLDLVTMVAKELQLVPDNVPDTAKAAKTVKTLMRTLATIVQGVAELRQGYGSGHGPDGKPRGLQPRHARLAAGAATTLARFLIDTHHERGA